MKTDGEPAFPVPGKVFIYGSRRFKKPDYIGMSLRDWIAGMALQGVIAGTGADQFLAPKDGAEISYKFADAMIAERSK
jgi:hypothetical protein